MKRRNQRGLATWAKWLIGIVVGGTVLLLATCSIVGFALYSQFGKMLDPDNAKQVTAQIATVKELPPRYKYSLGLDFFGQMTLVAIEDQEAKLLISLIKLPNQDAEMTQEKFVEQIAEAGVPTASSTGQQSTAKIEIINKGSMPVGGQEMPYVIGMTVNQNTGDKVPAFLGCSIPQGKKEAILICAVSNAANDTSSSSSTKTESKPEVKTDGKTEGKTDAPAPTEANAGQTVDLNAIKTFLGYIQSFK